MSPISTLSSWGSSSSDQRRSQRADGVTRGSRRILNSTPSLSLSPARWLLPLLRVDDHGPELVDREGPPIPADPGLAEQAGAGVAQPDDAR